MLKLFQTRAHVLRSRPFGEKDRLLTLFSLEAGKVTARAPGARHVKSKLSAGVEPLTSASFLLHRGRSIHTVSQLQIEQPYARIRVNIRDFALGLYLAELVEKTMEEGAATPPVYDLLADCWSLLNEQKGDRDMLVRFFELTLLGILGYSPHFTDCIFCGSDKAPFFWNKSSGGIFCRDCCSDGQSATLLTAGTLALLRSFLNFTAAKTVNLRGSEEQKRELQMILQQYLQYWTGIGPLKSLNFLQKI